MKSKIHRSARINTPHEEIMFCIESTNDIVSEILTTLKILSNKIDGMVMET